jgi:alkanesulfonate monooxygenase SsuD/methylene tetrahydromethanopterin reductase-like flavin-dependent oxidoreductase (luciferase family)
VARLADVEIPEARYRSARPNRHRGLKGWTVDIGLFNMNAGPCSWPDGAERIARLAEELNYESLWMGEHVVVPSPRVPPSPIEPTARMLDPLVALSFLAAVTERILLGTGIIILPQRNPLILAKQVASLDVLSHGRLLLGIGVGYLEPEFRAVRRKEWAAGVPGGSAMLDELAAARSGRPEQSQDSHRNQGGATPESHVPIVIFETVAYRILDCPDSPAEPCATSYDHSSDDTATGPP